MEKPISNFSAVLMVAVAVIFDLLQFFLNLLHFIPAIGNAVAFVTTSILTIIAWLTFYIWFKTKGVTFNTSKRMLSLGGGFLIELIPILNALPAWTLSVVIIIGSTRIPAILGQEQSGNETETTGEEGERA